MKYPVVKQLWEESERGWGIRPDGYSLHLTVEDAEKFIDDYWAKMPKGPAPDVYSRPGNQKLTDVTEEVYNKIKESKNGVRYY